MIKRYICIILFICFTLPLRSQQILLKDIAFENYAYSVKMIDEFMSRFNLKEVVVTPEQDSLWRFHNRIFLFDEATYMANDSLANEVIDLIENDSITLHFSDTTWMATATCQVKYDGKIDTIQLLLQPQIRKKNWYKWAIVDAFGDMLQLAPKTKSEHFYISPTDNELNFMSLTEITQKNYRNITEYAANGYEPDRLSVFYTLVYSGLLIIDYVTDLTYHFELPCKHSLDVRYFNRDIKNSGWLIYQIH